LDAVTLRSRSLVALLALASACKSNLQSVPPAIQLLDTSGAALSSLTFPPTGFGASSSQGFAIKSLSSTPLSVTALAISGPAQAFYTVAGVDGGSLPLSLDQDQAQSFVVTFAPVATPPVPQGLIAENATLTVTSNDPTNGSLPVPLSGQAAAPSLGVCWINGSGGNPVCLAQGPLAVQFGEVPLGRGNSSQPAVIQLSAASDGGVPVSVTSVAIDAAGLDAGFQLVSPIPTTPALLDGGNSLVYYVALFPRALGAATGSLIIESDDPHFPPSSPPQVSLLATVTPRSPPVACEGAVDDAPLVGAAITTDGGVLGAGWFPAPLDTVTITGIVDAGCSSDPVDPQASLQYGFSLVDGGEPSGTVAKLQSVSGSLTETSLQLDLVGTYEVSEVVTDLVGLPSPPATLAFTARPRDDIAAQLTWTASASQGPGVPLQLDLHLVRTTTPDAGIDAGTLLTSPNDCWWVNCLASQPRLPWGPGSGTLGDPLVGTEFGQPTAPFPQSAEAYSTLSGPQAGAEYDLYVWYFHTESGESVGTCTTDADCTVDPGYPHCNTLAASPPYACVPSGNATLRAFVGGQDVTDGGLAMTLGKPCDLWHAGTIQWLGGGQLPDGGTSPPQFTFTPQTALTSDGVIGCEP
jgi:hypothetical protein